MVIRIAFAILIVLSVVSGAVANGVKIQEWTFDKDQMGSVPAGFIPGKLNSEAGRWEVTIDPKATSLPHVLALIGSDQAGPGPQVIFIEGDEICETSYKDRGGKYQGLQGVTLPKI